MIWYVSNWLCKSNKMFTTLAYRWKTPSNIHLLISGIWISHQNHPVIKDVTMGKPSGNKSVKGNNWNFFIVWVSSCCPLLGCTRSHGKCSAAIQLSHCPELSGHAVHEAGSSFATKLSNLDDCENRKVVRWCRTQASSHNSQGIVDGKAN